MIKTILFDYGKVLWDYHPYYERIITDVSTAIDMSQEEFTPKYIEVYQEFETKEFPFVNWLKTITTDDKAKLGMEALQKILDDQEFYQQFFYRENVEYLFELKKTYQVGCLSNAESFIYETFNSHIQGFFDFCLLSWQTGFRKPQPEIYNEVFKHTQSQPSEILFIDDKEININAAKDLGFQTIHLTQPARLKELIQSAIIV
jgi:HAD superfamily hydrolase (TIGR01509 family)